MTIGFLTVFETLGSGAYGKVYRTTSSEGGSYAIKIGKTKESSRSIFSEHSILSRLHGDPRCRHSHIIQNYEIRAFTNQKMGLVLELLGSSLGQFEPNGLSLPETRRITKQLAKACEFIHSHRVIHSDIKPHNILFSLDRTSVKLADFGAAFFEDGARARLGSLQTIEYRSPEVVLGLAPTPAIDMWSVAVVVTEIYIGKYLFPADDDEELVAMHHVRLEKGYSSSLIDRGSAEGEIAFISGLLKKIELVNTLFQVVLASAILKKETEEVHQMIGLLNKLFVCDPKSRITATEVLKDDFFSQDVLLPLKRQKTAFENGSS